MEVKMTTIRFSFKNATILVCSLNVAIAVFLLLRVFSSPSSSPTDHSDGAAVLRYIKECEDLRLSMQPLELMKRVREIQHAVYTEPKMEQPKQTAALDLSKRLKDFRSANDAANLKALEEWRKRKMERARQRGLEMNGTASA
ncbi:hypothetical protein MLD38_027228 [Melastoma candidum]|uniref:Uncharacterized protein n=1 Tax=Melastoma candidum TaxID=119954 RepID=A0ACB9P4D9_9MYRT|nr:hypothetical protein MLD38_027228 [Melastoma candidum]